MGQLSSSGLCTRSGSAVAVRQGALQLRYLHEDTTGPDRGGRGEGTFLQHTEQFSNTTGELHLPK